MPLSKASRLFGEASKNLPVEWRKSYPEIPWRNIARMRDKLTHHYFDTNLEFIWLVMQTQINPLDKTVVRMLQKLPGALN